MRSPSEARSRSGSTTIALARTDRIASSTPSSYKPCPLILAERRFSGPWGDDGDCDWQGKYFVDLKFRACEMKYHESFNIAFELLLSAHAVSSMSWHLISLTTDKIHIEHWFEVDATCTHGVVSTLAHDLWAGSTPSLNFWFGSAALILVQPCSNPPTFSPQPHTKRQEARKQHFSSQGNSARH